MKMSNHAGADNPETHGHEVIPEERLMYWGCALASRYSAVEGNWKSSPASARGIRTESLLPPFLHRINQSGTLPGQKNSTENAGTNSILRERKLTFSSVFFIAVRAVFQPTSIAILTELQLQWPYRFYPTTDTPQQAGQLRGQLSSSRSHGSMLMSSGSQGG
jgi:hypothetical protein